MEIDRKTRMSTMPDSDGGTMLRSLEGLMISSHDFVLIFVLAVFQGSSILSISCSLLRTEPFQPAE